MAVVVVEVVDWGRHRKTSFEWPDNVVVVVVVVVVVSCGCGCELWL